MSQCFSYREKSQLKAIGVSSEDEKDQSSRRFDLVSHSHKSSCESMEKTFSSAVNSMSTFKKRDLSNSPDFHPRSRAVLRRHLSVFPVEFPPSGLITMTTTSGSRTDCDSSSECSEEKTRLSARSALVGTARERNRAIRSVRTGSRDVAGWSAHPLFRTGRGLAVIHSSQTSLSTNRP